MNLYSLHTWCLHEALLSARVTPWHYLNVRRQLYSLARASLSWHGWREDRCPWGLCPPTCQGWWPLPQERVLCVPCILGEGALATWRLSPPLALISIDSDLLVIMEERTPVSTFTAFVLKVSIRNSLQIHMDIPDCKNPADSFLNWLYSPQIAHLQKYFHVKHETFNLSGRVRQE